ncbi:IS5 family transposase [Georgenia muralis]|uniref:IS5 family transposase n=1 Tax=Georgenia muralis TaxID=154117 RepID=UPI003CCC5C69
MPAPGRRRGRPFREHRTVVEGIIYRYRAGIPWRDLPERFGPWQTVWKRHRRFSGDGTWDKVLTTLLTHGDAAGLVGWEVSIDSTVIRAHQHATNCRGTQGDLSNYMKPGEEPPDHAIGRSRGGLSTKIHHLCDGNMRPLVVLLGPGQGGDSPMFEHVMNSVRVPRLGPGRARTTPVRALADKAYSSKANRALLRRRDIKTVIPERSDQVANRKRRGSRGGRPVTYDTEAYRRRNVVERSFNVFKQWRALATRYDKLALTYRGGVVLRAITIWLKAIAGPR